MDDKKREKMWGFVVYFWFWWFLARLVGHGIEIALIATGKLPHPANPGWSMFVLIVDFLCFLFWRRARREQMAKDKP
jgi:hypothetical protein